MNTTTSTTSITAHVVRYEACLPRLAKLQRKAQRLGCAVPSMRLLARGEVVKLWRVDGTSYKAERDLVELTYGDIRFPGGWRLLAQVDHDLGEGNAVLRSVAGVEVPGAWAQASGFECDHCGKAIRRRNTYIVGGEGGEMKRVGGTCLRDFLGVDATLALNALKVRLDAEDLLTLDEGLSGGGGFDRILYELEEVLALASCAMRATGGYISRAKADELFCLSTAEMIRDTYHPHGKVKLTPEESDLALAETVAEWMVALNDRAEVSNYIESLSTYGRAGMVNWRGIGFVASAINAYQREQAEVVARKGRTSIHVGAVGETLDFLGKVVGIHRFDTAYGVNTLYNFVAVEHEDSTVPAGAAIKYISSRTLTRVEDGESLQRGDEVWLVATVKKHDEYREQKQTVVTRGSIAPSRAVRNARLAAIRAEKEAEKAALKAAKEAERAAARAAKAAAKAAKLAAKSASL